VPGRPLVCRTRYGGSGTRTAGASAALSTGRLGRVTAVGLTLLFTWAGVAQAGTNGVKPDPAPAPSGASSGPAPDPAPQAEPVSPPASSSETQSAPPSDGSSSNRPSTPTSPSASATPALSGASGSGVAVHPATATPRPGSRSAPGRTSPPERKRVAAHRLRAAPRPISPRSPNVLARLAAAKQQRQDLRARPAVTTQLPTPQRDGLLPLIGALVLLVLAAASTALMRALVRLTRSQHLTPGRTGSPEPGSAAQP
jgi:hypothetical protein